MTTLTDRLDATIDPDPLADPALAPAVEQLGRSLARLALAKWRRLEAEELSREEKEAS